MTKREKTLRSILKQAEAIRPREEDDVQMWELVSGIIVNTEDAIGALEDERNRAGFNSMFRHGVASLATRLDR